MTETNEAAPPVDADQAKQDQEEEGGKKKRKPRTAAKGEGGGTEKERPPWTGFRETLPSDAVITPAEAERAKRRDGLVLAEGFSYYLCLRNCGNGRFAAGRTYALRDAANPHPDHFRKMQ